MIAEPGLTAKYVPSFEYVLAMGEDKKEDIMTVAERLRQEGEVRGEIRGEIKTYKELLASGLLSKELVEQKIAELNRKLEKVAGKNN
jgi:predicted transposase YdaD